MTITALFILAFGVGLSGALAPGPLLTICIAESSRRGFVTGPLLVVGHGILELALILALLLLAGLSAFIQLDAVKMVIFLLGGAFLVYLGQDMVRSPDMAGFSPSSTEAAPRRGLHPVIAGVVVSLSNPYWSLWWATVGLSFLVKAIESGAIGVAAFFSGHILADLGWYSLVAAAVVAGRNVMRGEIFRLIFILCGVFLLGLGAFFLYQGVQLVARL